MADQLKLVEAIERFNSWGTPWEFFRSVAADPTLNEAERIQLNEIWTVTCDSSVWLAAANLSAGVNTTVSALAGRFPWLSTLACQQLARGASYDWR